MAWCKLQQIQSSTITSHDSQPRESYVSPRSSEEGFAEGFAISRRASLSSHQTTIIRDFHVTMSLAVKGSIRVVANAANIVANFAPVPYLSPAVVIIIGMIDVVDKVHFNK